MSIDGNSSPASGTTTTTALTSITPLSGPPGTNVTFNGTVTASSGFSGPTGQVFIRNGGPTGTILASGFTSTSFGTVATFSISSTTIPSGSYSNIQAFYVPDPGFQSSSSTVFPSTLTITGASSTGTTTTVTSSLPTAVYGTSLTFTATVTAASGTTPPTAGSVEFFDNGVSLGTTSTIVSTGSGFATFQYVTSANQMQVNGGAAHTISAVYTAGSGFTGSSSSGAGNASVTITPKNLTVVGGSASNKVYDGGINATVDVTGISFSGVVSGDTITPGGTALGAFLDKHVGTGKPVNVTGITIVGSAAANYTLTQPSYTANITQRPITVTAQPNSKVYNGNTASATTPSVTTGTLASGDTSGFTQTYDTKNVGTSKLLTPGGIVNDGNGGLNYAVTFVSANVGTITAAGLTVSGLSASNKVYDGTTAATITGTGTLVGVIPPDLVTLSGTPSGTFATRNVGTGLTVTVTGLSLSGADASNYTLTLPSLTANITVRPITVTGAPDSRVYDGTTSSVGVPSILGGLGTGDTPNFTQSFNTKHVGTNKPMIPAGTVSDGNGGLNYSITFITANVGTITARPITVTAATDTKVYDGTTNSTAVPTVTAGSIVTGDSGSFTQTFNNKNAGTGKTLTPAGIVNDGNSGNNYAVTFAPISTGVITQRPITVTAVTDTKPFDGTTSSSGVPVIGPGTIATGDTASFTQAFDTPAVGTGKTLTPSGSVLDGNSGLNYSYTFVPVNTGVITSVGTGTTTTVGTSLATTVYGTTVTFTATVVATSGTPTGSVTFFDDTMSVTLGTGTLLSASGTTSVWTYTTTSTQLKVTVPAAHVIRAEFTGTGGFNNSSGTLTGGQTVTPAPLSVTGITANDKVYNQSTAATLNTAGAALVGVFSGDTVTLNTAGAVGTFATANVGTGITVTITGLTISGTSASNYTLTAPTTTANITPVGLTVTGVTANNKVYDGTTAATLNTGSAALVGVLSGDTVTLTGTATGTFATRNVGTGIAVTVAGLTLGGAQAGNYTLTQPTTSAAITARPITVTAVTDTKFFDGTTTSTGIPVVTGGLGSGDTAAFTQSFDTPAIGTGKTLTPAGTVLDGNSGNNYTITFVPVNTGVITAPSTFSKRLDFNTSSLATLTAPGFQASLVSHTLALNGAGWTSAVNVFDTGAGGTSTPLLFRDFTWSGDQKTFQIQVTPAGTYSLRLYLGDSRPIGGYTMDVRAYDSLAGALPTFTTVTTSSGMFTAYVITGVASPSGVVNVDIRPTSGGSGAWVFNGLDIWDQGSAGNDPGSALAASPPPPAVGPSRRLDINAPSNPTATASGFTASLANDTLMANGAAWTSFVYTFDTAGAGSTSQPLLLRDFAWGQGLQTYQITATPGVTYSLRLYVGDSRTVNGGYAIQARAYANGTAAGMMPGFSTVSTTAGGFNELVLTGVTANSSGLINVDLQAAPGGNGIWVFNGLDIWDQASSANDPGSALGTPSVPPVPATRRFDFNAGTNTGTTAASFTGVLATDILSVNGRGWMTPVNMFNTTSGGSTSTPLLYQDFAWGTGARTFQMYATAGTTYSLRLYAGDSRGYAYTMWVRAYDSLTPSGSLPVFSPFSTSPGGFNAIVLSGVSAPSGIINVEITAAPGGNGVWVFNGLDVWDQSSSANDPGLAPQLAATVQSGSRAAKLTEADLAPLVQEAIARWAATGIDAAQLAALQATTFRIADLDATGALGLTGLGSNVITLDDDGAGLGWFIDPTPNLDDEFGMLNATELVAGRKSPAAGKYDLLTVIQHELGHVIGLPDLSRTAAPHDLMTEYLTPGMRRLGTAVTAMSMLPPDVSTESIRGRVTTIESVPARVEIEVATTPATALPVAEKAASERWLAPALSDDQDDALWLSGVKVG